MATCMTSPEKTEVESNSREKKLLTHRLMIHAEDYICLKVTFNRELRIIHNFMEHKILLLKGVKSVGFIH